jgi:NitT/TauT family transport system substrate-binding protein
MAYNLKMLVLAGMIGFSGQMNTAHALETVRVSQAGYQLYRLPLYIAQIKGFFKEENLDVQFISTNSGSDSVKMLVGSAVEFENGPVIDIVNLRKQGIEAKTIGVINSRLNNSIIVPKAKAGEIKSFSDLAGKTVGMTGIGSGTWQVMAAVAKTTNTDLDKINMVSLGTQGIMQAFLAGRVDALSYVDPEAYLLLKSGDGVPLIDFNDDATHKKYLGDATIYNELIVLDSYANANPAIVQGFMNGVQKALNWLHSTPSEEIVTTVKGYEPFKDLPPEDIKGMLDRTGKGYPKSAVITKEAFDGTMNFMSVVGALDAPLPQDETVNNAFAEKAAATLGNAK